jgi:hypothetical protein
VNKVATIKESDNKKNAVSNYILYIIFFIIIFISDDTFNFGTNENVTYLIVKYIIYFFLTIYLVTNSNLRFLTVLTKSSLIFYSIIISVLITSFFNFNISGGYVYQIWLFLLGILIVNFFTQKQFVDIYLRYIYVLSVISLIVFSLASISLSIFELFPVQSNSAGATMYNLGACIVFADGVYIRNTSIFREPGVFMIYLNIGIMFELFFKSEINKRNLFVFILTIFSTLSTAAFIALGTIFIAYLFTKSTTKSSVKTKRFVIMMIIVAMAAIILSGELYSMVFDKMGKDNIADGSSLARGVSVLANLNIFLDNMIFGVGISDYPASFGKYTLDLVGISMDVGNNTNTITTILAVYGVLFGCVFIYMMISFAKKTSKSIIVRSFIFLVLIMLYSNEELRYSLMSATFLMWGVVSRKKEEVI